MCVCVIGTSRKDRNSLFRGVCMSASMSLGDILVSKMSVRVPMNFRVYVLWFRVSVESLFVCMSMDVTEMLVSKSMYVFGMSGSM